MTTGSFDNDQASLVLTEVEPLFGVYPSDNGASEGDTLGMIRLFAFNFAPGGSVAAQGQALQTSQNQALSFLLGTAYGPSPAGTYRLPNLAGTVAIGDGTSTYGTNTARGDRTGQDTASVTQAQLPPVLGGSSQPVSDLQPSLGVNYAIRVSGLFPQGASGVGVLGQVVAYTGDRVPAGFVPADGRQLQISQNQPLFSVLGFTYGGNLATTFAVPDLRGRNIVGTSATLQLGTVTGTPSGSVNLNNTNAPVANRGGGTPFNNQAPGLALNYIIALQGTFPPRDGGSLDPDNPYVGEVEAFAGSPALIPKGWALANGQVLPIQQNVALFSLIGTTYGGDGKTTFALPNLGNRVVVGSGTSPSGTSYTVGELFGQNDATLQVTCFLPGTLIRTPGGEVPIEHLRIGDAVLLATGGSAPVRWVARQTVATRFADPLRVCPVRVRAGALADGVPARDLLCSPDHALFLDGVLVQAGALVNGTSIVREMQVPERFTYYNLELAEHALIWAEDTVAETFVDNVGRGVFDNAAEHAALYPDAPWIAEMDAPRAKSARQVPAALRQYLAARSGAARAAEAA